MIEKRMLPSTGLEPPHGNLAFPRWQERLDQGEIHIYDESLLDRHANIGAHSTLLLLSDARHVWHPIEYQQLIEYGAHSLLPSSIPGCLIDTHARPTAIEYCRIPPGKI